MEIENEIRTNPLLGIANFVSALMQGRFSKNGIELPAAEKVEALALDNLKNNI